MGVFHDAVIRSKTGEKKIEDQYPFLEGDYVMKFGRMFFYTSEHMFVDPKPLAPVEVDGEMFRFPKMTEYDSICKDGMIKVQMDMDSNQLI